MFTSEEVAERIKDRAKQQGKTMKEVLEITQLSKTAMNKMKTSYPQANNLTKIADELGCSLDYLMGRTDNPDINK